MTKKVVAICVGHSRSGDKGAVNVDGVTEWAFNQPLAKRICELIEQAGHSAVMVDRYEGGTYTSAMLWLAKRVKEVKADVALELHFNSAGRLATGYEFLPWFSSTKGLALGQKLLGSFAKFFPEQKSRGIKPCDASDRGGLFLRKTPCVALVCEPFFGSNVADTAFFSARREELARAYAEGVLNWLATQ